MSIRPGWFYHPSENERVRSIENLVNLYVGRTERQAAPERSAGAGWPAASDRTSRLSPACATLSIACSQMTLPAARAAWRVTGARTAELTIDFARASALTVVRLQEDISRGQVVARIAWTARVRMVRGAS